MMVKERTKDAGRELRTVFVETLQDMAKTNQQIVVVEADLGGASFSTHFKETCPERFINVGVCEANMYGLAAGLSLRGYTPYVHSLAPFATRRAFDQLFISCAYAKNTVNIYASDPGVCVGVNGGTHTSFEDIAMMRAVPEAVIFDPADEVQMEWVMRKCATRKGVHYIRASRKSTRHIYEKGTEFEIGKGNVLVPGSDVLLISSGFFMNDALDAAEKLAAQGVSVEVVDIFTIKPLDAELIIKEARGKKLVATYENHNVLNGLGSAVADVLAQNNAGVPLLKIGVQDVFGQVGTVEFLQAEFGLTSDDVVKYIKEAL